MVLFVKQVHLQKEVGAAGPRGWGGNQLDGVGGLGVGRGGKRGRG